jgi:hypothetical protein
MNILFTNHRLFKKGGTEAIIRDLAVNLERRGHTVLLFSSAPAPFGNSLADDGVPITTRLDSLPFVPDIIHAHHHIDSMTAIMALPGVPAVYSCHGATRSDAQPKHPRILRYVAMTHSLRLRMVIESNIPEEEIEVVHNAVDLTRFSTTRHPPDQPRRALVYSGVLVPTNPLGAAIQEAARDTGLRVEFSGSLGGGRTISNPQELLLGYDIVFASGKSAIDAMACGCAVIVLSGAAGGWAAANCGEMVDPANFERLRQVNFSVPSNASPPSVTGISEQIGRYTAANTEAVSRRIREVADFDIYVEQFIAIYQRVIDLSRNVDPSPRAEQRAAYEYLRSISPWAQLADERQTSFEPPTTSGEAPVSRPDRVVNGPLMVAELKNSVDAIERRSF